MPLLKKKLVVWGKYNFLGGPRINPPWVGSGTGHWYELDVECSCLLLIDKSRVKEKTYICVSV